jgi:flagellar basal body-associated protein FliL
MSKKKSKSGKRAEKEGGYKSSLLRYIILAVLLVVLVVMAVMLWKKWQREKEANKETAEAREKVQRIEGKFVVNKLLLKS